MTVGCSAAADSVSTCTSLMSADCSRKKGLLVSSEDDKESRRERLTPMMCADSGCEVMKAGSTFVKPVMSSLESLDRRRGDV